MSEHKLNAAERHRKINERLDELHKKLTYEGIKKSKKYENRRKGEISQSKKRREVRKWKKENKKLRVHYCTYEMYEKK